MPWPAQANPHRTHQVNPLRRRKTWPRLRIHPHVCNSNRRPNTSDARLGRTFLRDSGTGQRLLALTSDCLPDVYGYAGSERRKSRKVVEGDVRCSAPTLVNGFPYTRVQARRLVCRMLLLFILFYFDSLLVLSSFSICLCPKEKKTPNRGTMMRCLPILSYLSIKIILHFTRRHRCLWFGVRIATVCSSYSY